MHFPADPLGPIGVHATAGRLKISVQCIRRLYGDLAVSARQREDDFKAVSRNLGASLWHQDAPAKEDNTTKHVTMRDLCMPRSDANLTFAQLTLPLYTPPLVGGSDVEARAAAAEAYEWPGPSQRAYIVYALADLFFKVELWRLDDLIMQLHPEQVRTTGRGETRQERLQEVAATWGSTSFAPLERNLLAVHEWTLRLPAVCYLQKIVSSWPRVQLKFIPGELAAAGEEAVKRAETEVWSAYAQSYYDYFARDPPFPPLHPS